VKEDFEEWAKGKISLANYDSEYATLETQIAWQAWQRSWNIAIRAQRQRDEAEIHALKNKILIAKAALTTKVVGAR
jgi:hypothetical protein